MIEMLNKGVRQYDFDLYKPWSEVNIAKFEHKYLFLPVWHSVLITCIFLTKGQSKLSK